MQGNKRMALFRKKYAVKKMQYKFYTKIFKWFLSVFVDR